MRLVITFGVCFLVGYLAVTKVAPAIQAKLEALDIDDMWEVWDSEEEVDD